MSRLTLPRPGNRIVNRRLRGVTGSAYDALPEVVQDNVSRKEYLWLSDEEKANLVTGFVTPPEEIEDPAW